MKGVWQLPVFESRMTNEQHIKHNSKYHFFEYEEPEHLCVSPLGRSVCGKHTQDIGDFESIESGQVLQFPVVACKKCFEIWKKKYLID